jgi:hypothetical protein
MFTNGNTAIECGGGVKAGASVGAAVAGVPVLTVGDAVTCFEIQNLSATKYASAAKTTATVTHSAGPDHAGPRKGRCGLGVVSDSEGATGCSVGT